MPFVFAIPSEYGYVILAITSTFVLNLAHVQNTGKYRRLCGVEFPNAYASIQQVKEDPKAFAFNCAQRSHANFTEHHTTAVVSMLLAGLQFPLTTAACGFGWTVARTLYMVGYSNSTPGTAGKGRYRGGTFWLFELALMGMAGWVGAKMIVG